jgi:Phasin protein
MPSTDENKPADRPGQRKRKGEQRSRKPDQPQNPKLDQQQDAGQQTAATARPDEAFPMGAIASSENPSTGALVPIDSVPIGAVVRPDSFLIGFQTIAAAYGAYSRKSLEQTGSFIEKLSGVSSLDKAIEIHAEFAKQAYETFFAESQKICELYGELAKQIFRPLEGFVAWATQTAR